MSVEFTADFKMITCCSVLKHNLVSCMPSLIGRKILNEKIMANLLQNFLPPKFCIVQYS